MSFTFGNSFSVENQLKSIEETLNRLYPEREMSLGLKHEFIAVWLPPMAMTIDFEKLGITEPPVNLDDCIVDYEYVGGGQAIFLTTYISQEAMDKDAEFIQAAKSCQALTLKGLQAAVLFDKSTTEIMRNALLKARKATA